MRYANLVTYVPDADKVSALRPSHQAYVRMLMGQGKLLLAGPFTDGSGALFVYEADTMAAAEKLAIDDPYHDGGAFADYRIAEWDIRAVHPTLLEAK